jgi:hypothetical protein
MQQQKPAWLPHASTGGCTWILSERHAVSAGVLPHFDRQSSEGKSLHVRTDTHEYSMRLRINSSTAEPGRDAGMRKVRMRSLATLLLQQSSDRMDKLPARHSACCGGLAGLNLIRLKVRNMMWRHDPC